MKHFKILLFAWCLIIISCQQEQNKDVNLSLDFSELKEPIKKIPYFNIASDVFGELTPDSNRASFSTNQNMLLRLPIRGVTSYIYAKPGETISLEKVDATYQFFNVSEDQRSAENQYLLDYQLLDFKTEKDFELTEMAKAEPAEFLSQIEEKYKALIELDEDLQSNPSIDQDFKDLITQRVGLRRAVGLYLYDDYYKHLNKKDPELPDNFYAAAESIDLKNPDILNFEESQFLLNEYTSKDIDFSNYENLAEFFTDLYKANKEKLGNGLTGQYRAYNIINNMISFGGELKDSEAMVDEFRQASSNKYLNDQLDKSIAPWLKLQAGMDAPNFEASTRDGEMVSLSDLKGKKIYVDVWATWCGPCIAEIPSLKSLETELHAENLEFVSVSIDQLKDKEKWMKFIDDKDLKGIQLMADNAWESDIATDYNIKGIPRFILIDESGKLLDADAPRPSDPKIKELLTKI